MMHPELVNIQNRYERILDDNEAGHLTFEQAMDMVNQLAAIDGDGYVWSMNPQTGTFLRAQPGGIPQPADAGMFIPAQIHGDATPAMVRPGGSDLMRPPAGGGVAPLPHGFGNGVGTVGPDWGAGVGEQPGWDRGAGAPGGPVGGPGQPGPAVPNFQDLHGGPMPTDGPPTGPAALAGWADKAQTFVRARWQTVAVIIAVLVVVLVATHKSPAVAPGTSIPTTPAPSGRTHYPECHHHDQRAGHVVVRVGHPGHRAPRQFRQCRRVGSRCGLLLRLGPHRPPGVYQHRCRWVPGRVHLDRHRPRDRHRRLYRERLVGVGRRAVEAGRLAGHEPQRVTHAPGPSFATPARTTGRRAQMVDGVTAVPVIDPKLDPTSVAALHAGAEDPAAADPQAVPVGTLGSSIPIRQSPEVDSTAKAAALVAGEPVVNVYTDTEVGPVEAPVVRDRLEAVMSPLGLVVSPDRAVHPAL